VLPYLDESRFSYAFVDCRGYGEAMSIGGEYSTAEVAADTLALADHLGWESFSVIGHSMGGKVAQRIVADAPDRVRKLVGVSPVPASGTGMDAATTEFFTSAAHDPTVRRMIIDRGTGRPAAGALVGRHGGPVAEVLDHGSVRQLFSRTGRRRTSTS